MDKPLEHLTCQLSTCHHHTSNRFSNLLRHYREHPSHKPDTFTPRQCGYEWCTSFSKRIYDNIPICWSCPFIKIESVFNSNHNFSYFGSYNWWDTHFNTQEENKGRQTLEVAPPSQHTPYVMHQNTTRNLVTCPFVAMGLFGWSV